MAAAQAVAVAIFLIRQGIELATVRGRLIDPFGYDLAPERTLSRGGFDVSAAEPCASWTGIFMKTLNAFGNANGAVIPAA